MSKANDIDEERSASPELLQSEDGDWSADAAPIASSTPPRTNRDEAASPAEAKKITNYKLFAAGEDEPRPGRPLSDSHVEKSGKLKVPLRQKASRIFNKITHAVGHARTARSPRPQPEPVDHYPRGLYVHTRAGGTRMMLMNGTFIP